MIRNPSVEPEPKPSVVRVAEMPAIERWPGGSYLHCRAVYALPLFGRPRVNPPPCAHVSAAYAPGATSSPVAVEYPVAMNRSAGAGEPSGRRQTYCV